MLVQLQSDILILLDFKFIKKIIVDFDSKFPNNDWFKRMIDYGFIEGVDFNLLKNEQVHLNDSAQ